MRNKVIILFLLLSICTFHLQLSAQGTKKDKKEAKKIIKRADRFLAEEIPNFNSALNMYLDALRLDPDNALLNFKIGACYIKSIYKTKAIGYLKKALKLDPEVNPETLFILAELYHLNMEFDKAIREFKRYKQTLKAREMNSKLVLRILAESITGQRVEEISELVIINDIGNIVDKRIRECKIAKELVANPVDVTIENIGSAINTPYPEYSPIISADESVMYFTARRPNTVGGEKDPFDGHYYEDIYVSYNINGKWTKAVNLGTQVNTRNHDSAIGLSVDGQTLFTYSYENRGDIYVSKLKGQEWSKPKSLNKKINTPYTERSIAISGDEKTLIFISNRKGGYGGRDIYKCIKDEKGKWETPINLGPMLNTRYDEDGVFFHPDGKTLYFSSKGHNSMGGYDIFKTTYEGEKWSRPENMGYPINTPYDDIFFVVTASGERAYLTTVRKKGKGEKDIYVINMKKPIVEEEKPEEPVNPLTLLKGIITDAISKKIMEASIILVDNERNEVIAEFNSNSYSGKYLVTLPSGINYGIAVQKEGYLFHSENFDIPASADYQEIIKDIELKRIAVGTKIVLRNIFFDFDKATLRKTSVTELERLYQFLMDFPNMKIEIAGHTDNKGSADYNQNLSERRAKSVVKYLIDRGIPQLRLRAMGYGEAKPIAPNKKPDGSDDPEGRQQNRRTEFEILEN